MDARRFDSIDDYELSVSRNLFSEAEVRQFGARGELTHMKLSETNGLMYNTV